MGLDSVPVRLDRHRLRAPRPFAHEVPRPHLDELAQRTVTQPLMLVQADAGYGKTAFARRCAQGHPSAWYCLDTSDNDPQRLAAHLAAAFDALVPETSPRSSSRQDTHWLEVVDQLIDHLEITLPEQSVVVVDDLHVIDDEQTLSALAYFLEHLPAPLSAVVTTQHRPSLPGLHRWQAEGRLTTVGRDELAFREEEVAAFFAARFGQALDECAVRAVHDRCEGWPIAMNLVGAALTSTGSTRPPRAAHRLGELPRERLAEYLREHVLAGHEPSTREFLLLTSVVDDFDQELADAILAGESSSVLSRVKRSGLYLTSDGLGTYSYQGWFRDFLRDEIDGARAQLAHRRAAEHLEAQGRLEDAALQFTAAGDAAAAARLLDDLAPVLVSQGQHARLLTLSDSLPRELLLRHPKVSLARADALRFACRFEDSQHEAVAALGEASTRANAPVAFAALERLVRIHLDTVRPAGALSHLEEMASLLPGLEESHRARLEQLRAENDLNSGRLPAVVAHLDVDEADPLLAARLAARLGNVHGALAHLRSAPGEGSGRAPRSHREHHALAAWLLALQGDGQGALREARSGIELGKVLASPIIECVCTGRAGLALLCTDSTDAGEEALELCASSLALADQIRLPRFRAEGLMGLTIAHGRRRDWPRARQHGIEALEILTAAGDDYLAAMARLCLGVAGAACGHPEAAQWLEAAITTSAATGEHLVGTTATLWQAEQHLTNGDRTSASMAADRAVQAMRFHALDFLLTGSSWVGIADPDTRRRLAELAVESADLHRYAGYLAQASRGGSRSPSPQASPWGLHVRVLGDFVVQVDGHPVPENAWKRRKARELFWLLCVHPSHSVTRAEAADALWPDGKVEPTSVRFRVALHALREALEPDRTAGESRFVRSNDERIWLDPLVTIDVDAYRDVVAAASRPDASAEPARRAVDLYAGPLLAAAPAAEWVVGWREELADSWRWCALRAADHEIEQGTPAGVIPLLREVVRESPYEDAAHRLLARALADTGQPTAASAVHAHYARLLASDLGVAPGWTLEDLGL